MGLIDRKMLPKFVCRTTTSSEVTGDSDEILFQHALTELLRQKDIQSQMLARERTLLQIMGRISQATDLDMLLSTSSAEIRLILNTDRVAIFQFSSMSQLSEGKFVAEDSVAACKSNSEIKNNDFSEADYFLDCFGSAHIQAYQNGETLIVPDILTWNVSSPHEQSLKLLRIAACIITPLFREQKLWGLILVQQYSSSRQWTLTEVETLSRIALSLDVAIQQVEFLNETKIRSLELQNLLEEINLQKAELTQVALQERAASYVIRRMRHSLDVNQIFRITTREIREILQCDRVAVYQFHADWSGEFIHESVGAKWMPLITEDQNTSWTDTYLQEYQGGRFQNLESAVTPDIYKANYSDCHLEKLEEFQVRASVILPVLIGDSLWGLLGAYQNSGPRDWQSRELRLLEQVADQLGVALQQASLLKQLTQAKEEADAANKAKGTFLANMSHELRTPLNTILGFTQLMSRDHNSTADQRDTLDIINRSGAHLLNLINDILEMSKIESGRQSVNPKNFDFYGLINNLMESFKFKVQGKGLDLILECEASVPHYIQTDESKLSQVLINLMGNAVKFTAEGFVALHIKIDTEKFIPETETNLVWLNFLIEDTGYGIESKELDTVFDAFIQTETGRKETEGTGLGLTISRHFIELMGGKVTISSQQNQGTKVSFSIPVRKASAIETPLLPDRRIVSLMPDQPTYRILVVDDHPENRQLMLRLLGSVGFDTRAVSNGMEAIAQWCTWCPHLIWIDEQMPVMNGFDAVRQIREFEFLRDEQQRSDESTQEMLKGLYIPSTGAFSPLTKTVIIALTASVFEETQLKAEEAGCDGFMSKPFQEKMLFEKMAEFLGVQYQYDLPTKNNNNEDYDTNPVLSPVEVYLSQQSEHWLNALHEAALELDEEMISTLIKDIENQCFPLAILLNSLLKNLEFSRVAYLSQNALSSQQDTR
jgi:two-component system, sensor histidine kinase and response regulator